MLTKRFFFLLVVCVLISFQYSFSQRTKSFPKDKKIFLERVETFFKESRNINKDQKESIEIMLIDLNQLWNSGAISEKEKTQLIATSNLMLKARMRQFPHFFTFFNCIIDFKNSNQSEESYNAFFKGISGLLSYKKSRHFVRFLKKTNDLLKYNYIHNSRSLKWYSTNNDFYFETDATIKIVFPSLDLICKGNKDSSVITNTKGIYYPIENKWLGEGGKITWERAGFDANDVYAQIGKYKIDMKFARYSVDSVKFFYPAYFPSFLSGSIREKVMANVTKEKASYPRFSSHDKRLAIKNIFQNIDYEGGFAMNGAKILGTGDKFQDAYLRLKKDGEEFVVIASKAFTIRKDRILSNSSSVNIYWKGDSIHHPSLEMKYMNDTKELTLIRGMNDISKSPFFNTYHKLDMYFEAMYWKMDEVKINFSMIRSVGRTSRATFESFNYYSESRFYKLRGIDEINPLYRIKKYIKNYDSRKIYVSELSQQMKIDPAQVKAMLIRLSNLGFLIYDPDDEFVYVKDKVNEYIKALNKKTDYDILQFHSAVNDGVNASLSLLNFDLKIKGVPIVFLSDSQNVFVYPSNQQVLVKKNRDFLFSGRIHAGRFDYYAKGCSFLYDDFKLNMPVIDSMSVKVLAFTPDKEGKRPLVRLKTVIQALKGDILVDYPTNKSGLKPYSQYPIFNSKGDSYVYYDKPSIQNGVYSQDNFYYHVKPFTIKNIDKFQTDNLKFDGSLTSAGIFPEIVEPLKVQPDYSLGITKITSQGGIANYGGKGTFFNKINLSHKGLRGDGKLEYLTSTSKSNNFIFLPDSMNTIAQSFVVKEQTTLTEYPQLSVTNVKEHWRPYKDSLTVTQIDAPFAMYNKGSRLNGKVVLTPKGLSGSGRMVFERAEMDANSYNFKQHCFDADTANFRLRTYDLTDLAFNTENYKSHIDFEKRIGEFKSNGGVSTVNFPINRYISYMDLLIWSMDKDELALKNTKKLGSKNIDRMSLKELLSANLPGSDFVSTHPAQDSLRFRSPKALFNLKDYVLTVENVKLIKVADAAIAPDQGKVVILRQAEMQALEDAKILANRTTKYHSFYQALATIQGKKSYAANGYYDYIDENATKHQIFFDKIALDSNRQTYATGSISDSSDFVLSPAFDFTGNVKLRASNKFLHFTGGTQIHHSCGQESHPWLKFNAEINPKEIFIPIGSEPRDINNKKLTTAILHSTTISQVHTSFIEPKRFRSDVALISADGYLTYNKLQKKYKVASKNKLRDADTLGNMLVLDVKYCTSSGEGIINLGSKLGRVNVETYGIITNKTENNEAILDLVMPVDFFFNDNALKMMAESFYTNNNLRGIEALVNGKVKRAFAEMLDKKEAKEVINEMNMYGALRKVPEKLDYTMFLTDVKMRYDDVSKSFISMGEIGIGHIGKVQINKYVNGHMQMIKKRSGDIFTLYLELDESEWYFFHYSNNLMQAYSSIKAFNDFIVQEKPEKRRLESTKKGKPSYSYYRSTERKKNDFIKRMNPPPEEEEEDFDTE